MKGCSFAAIAVAKPAGPIAGASPMLPPSATQAAHGFLTKLQLDSLTHAQVINVFNARFTPKLGLKVPKDNVVAAFLDKSSCLPPVAPTTPKLITKAEYTLVYDSWAGNLTAPSGQHSDAASYVHSIQAHVRNTGTRQAELIGGCWTSQMLRNFVLTFNGNPSLDEVLCLRSIFTKVFGPHYSIVPSCYDPPQFFSSSSDPLLVTLSNPPLMAKRPLPLNPSPLPDLPPLLPSEPSKPSSPLDQPPVEPLVPIPWNIHRQEYSSMEMYQEPPLVENPLEDPDNPMEDAPPLELQPVTHYEPDVPGGQTHTLSPDEPPIEPWEAYLTQPSSPVSRKHSLSPTSPSSAPIRQRTSHEGSYQSITPPALSPIAGTLPQSQGYQSTSPRGSTDKPSSTQSSADDADSDMALNWVTINTHYLKG